MSQPETSLILMEETALELNNRADELIKELVATRDPAKQQIMVDLFNQNQKLKAMIREEKYSRLLDREVDLVEDRILKRPDEIDTKQLVDTMKVTQELLTKTQQMLQEQQANPTTMINITDNSHTSTVNVDPTAAGFDRAARRRVDSVLSTILQNINKNPVIPDGEDNE